MDETGIQKFPYKHATLLTKLSKKQVGYMASTEQEITTVICCCNAAGSVVPPFMVFENHQASNLLDGAPLK